MKLKLRKPGVYVMELLILIAGISISFMLNEWRQSRIEQGEKDRIIQQLRADLERDTSLIHTQLDFIENMSESAMKLLRLDTLSRLSDIRNDFGIMVNTVSQRFSSSTFIELESTGKLALIENDSLRHRIIAYYNRYLPQIYEWHDVDKNQYLPRITTYLEEHMPFSLGFSLTDLNEADSLRFLESLKADQFKHIIQYNLVVKSGIVMSYAELNTEAETILNELGREH